MKIIVYICVAFLPSIFHCTSEYDSNGKKIDLSLESEQIKKLLNEMAKNNTAVNDIFQPSVKGFLGFGSFGTMYKGTLLYPNTDEFEVAMKFTHIEDKKYAEKEYEIYSYLDAIDNPKIELNGIPSVYYYGTWNNYIMMGITLLDSGLDRNYKAGTINEVDLLIVCREFVRAIKYIHSCGIYHDDIRFANLMFRRSNGFIIDFNIAEKMYNTTNLDTSSRKIGMKNAKNDWKRFLQSISDYCDIDIDFNFNISEPESKSQIEDIVKKLETKSRYDEIQTVSLEMTNYIFGIGDYSRTNDVSAYDRIYKVIEEEINDCGDIIVHWLTGNEQSLAIEEYSNNLKPSISSIKDPLTLITINYPEVDSGYFQKKISQLKSGKSSSGRPKKPIPPGESSKSGSSKKKKRF